MPTTETTQPIAIHIWAREYFTSCEVIQAAINNSIVTNGSVVTLHVNESRFPRGRLTDLLAESCDESYLSLYKGEDINGRRWSVLVGA